MQRWRVQVAGNGRLSLPIELRRKLGLEKGGSLTVELEGDEARLLTVAARVRRAQRLMREALGDRPPPTVEELIAWKRDEARRDAGKLDRLDALVTDDARAR